jgi:hypothetical protein
MEANVFKKRIEQAYNSKEFIKIIFQYPGSDRAIIKRGTVKSIADNGFEIEEIKDGLTAYAYTFIVEVKGEIKNNEMGY